MSSSAEPIRSRMESLRGQLVQDVDDVVESAKSMIDWRVYVRKYPWACVGAAAAVGYLLVPKRVEVIRPDADTLLELAQRKQLVALANPSGSPPRGMAGTLFQLVAKAAVRTALSHLGQQRGADGAHPGERRAHPPS